MRRFKIIGCDGTAWKPAYETAQALKGVAWSQFGDQVFIWQTHDTAPHLPQFGREAEGDGSAMHPPLSGQPCLVVQAGNAFHVDHPQGRVLINKGRYLVVDLTADELRTFQAESESACFGICPLPLNQVVLERRLVTGRGQDPLITPLVGQVSQFRMTQSVAALTALRTRHSTSTEFSQATDVCRDRLASLGYATLKQSITVQGSSSFNVVANKDGSGVARRLWIVCAHLDSINHAGGSGAVAPGADDNASGVAAALEIAEILAAEATRDDLRIVLFGGEEQGLYGSRQYVAALPPAEHGRVAGVINMDMVARLNTASPTVMLEGAPLSQDLINQLAAAAADYTSLAVQTSLYPFASDHVPFIDAGIPAVLTIEGADSTNHDVHTASDTPDKLNIVLAQQIVKTNLAVLAQGLGLRASAPRTTSGPVVAWGANRLDVFVVGTDRRLYHKWWNGSAWCPSLTGYEAMGGVCTCVPQSVAWGPNRLDVFVTGTDSQLYHKWWNGSAWGPSLTGYEAMGGVIQGDPRVVSWGANRLDVFVLGTDRQLYHKWWNGSAWGPSLTGYEAMGGVILGQPEVVSWGPNRLDIFVVGTDRQLYHKWWNGSAWGPSLTGWEAMGGVCASAPRAVCWGPNRIDVFVIGTDGALYHKWWNGSAWGPSLTGWERMGGVCVTVPEVVAWGPNRLDVFVIGTDSQLYHKWWNGSAWGPSLTGYEAMGGVCTSPPRVVAWGPNRLDVFVTGTNSALFHKWWNGSAWGPSLTGYEGQGGVIKEF